MSSCLAPRWIIQSSEIVRAGLEELQSQFEKKPRDCQRVLLLRSLCSLVTNNSANSTINTRRHFDVVNARNPFISAIELPAETHRSFLLTLSYRFIPTTIIGPYSCDIGQI
ncbi:hypothetical protein ACHWQZ_G009593 [Mnemiopsis leidyi]